MAGDRSVRETFFHVTPFVPLEFYTICFTNEEHTNSISFFNAYDFLLVHWIHKYRQSEAPDS